MTTKKNILVTGATGGLGLAIVRRLARDGFFVIGSGRQLTPALAEFVAGHPGKDGKVCFEPCDLLCSKNLHGFVNGIVRTHGPLYGLVNNAALGFGGMLATMHETQIEELLTVNLTSAIILTKYAVRSMLLQREGRVVNIASIVAFTGFNGLSVYAATKAGLLGFSKSLARELGKVGITVNCIAPGYLETGMTAGLEGEKLESVRRRSPLGRLATPPDVAGAVSYLMGPDAAAVTGTTLTVDAGSTA